MSLNCFNKWTVITIEIIRTREVSASRYAKNHGIGYETVKRRCEKGELPAYQTYGGQWRIRELDGFVTKEEYENLKIENTELKEKLRLAAKILSE